MIKWLAFATPAAGLVLTLLWALCLDDRAETVSREGAWIPRNSIASSDSYQTAATRSGVMALDTRAAFGSAPASDSAGGAAVGAFLQAFWTRDIEREKRFPRSNEARDAISPYSPDITDASRANLAAIEQRARHGSDLALGAFLIVAAGTPDYTARAQELLLLNAANGSVLALTTLAGYASTGYGFGQPDIEAAIAYEYLAWRTGSWNSTSLAFVPTLVPGWTTAKCLSAIEVVDRLVTDSEMFPGTTDIRERNCV